MTENGKSAMYVIGAIVLVLFATTFARGAFGFGFGFAGPFVVGLLSLWPLYVLGAVIWFGREVITTLRRIEASVSGRNTDSREFVHGA